MGGQCSNINNKINFYLLVLKWNLGILSNDKKGRKKWTFTV